MIMEERQKGREGEGEDKQLLDDLKKKRRYWNLKVETLGNRRTCFGRDCGPVARLTM
jgi:hypothetical protein